MNKNPFLPQPSYNPPQPPLPPGPPPPQPSEYPHWPGYPQPGQYNPQWTPPTGRPGEQNPLFANYGYGPQNQWQRQQHQQQQQQYHPPPVVQPPPSAPYNPYQPAVTYAQPYPQPPIAQPQYAPPQPSMFAPHLPPQMPMAQQRQQQQQQPRQLMQSIQSSHQQPPAKRPRYDGPNANNHRSPQTFQVPTAPHGGGGPGHSRGGGPGSNQVPLGSGNRGGAGGNRTNLGGSNRGRGGGSMGAGRGGGGGGMGLRTGRGGSSFNMGGGNNVRGGGPMRSHGSRNNLGGNNKDFHNRRGPGGSFNAGGSGSYGSGSGSGSGSFRSGRNQGHTNSTRNQRHEANTSVPLGLRDTTNTSMGKRGDQKRNLTDFKIVGLEIPELSWTWGALPSKDSSGVKVEDASDSQIVVKKEDVDDDSSLTKSHPEASGSDADFNDGASVTTEVAGPSTDNADASQTSISDSKDASGSVRHSRIRIYFHTPVSAEDSHVTPHSSFTLGSGSSPSRKGKRKKLDDDDGDLEEGRGPPPPPQMSDDRSSMAPSVAPSVTETTSEADWLMAAIVEGDETQRDEGDHDGNNDDDEDDGDDGERRHVSDIVEIHENDAMSDVDVVEADVSVSREHDVNMEKAAQSTSGTSGAIGVSENASESEVAGNSVSLEASGPQKSHIPSESSGPSDQSGSANADVTPSNTSKSTNEATLHSEKGEKLSSTDLTQQASQTTEVAESQNVQGQGHDDEHLPEPPASPAASNTLISTPASSTVGEAPQPSSSTETKPANTRTPSTNRISISYAGGETRLIIDAEVVESFKIFRNDARMEVRIKLESDAQAGIKGLSKEVLLDSTRAYVPISEKPPSHDSVLPPFCSISMPSTITLVVYLDTDRPLSEPRWVKTGDIPDWLRSMIGKVPLTDGWPGKIRVVDPDPPPTIWTVLDGWASNSPVGSSTERQRFVKTHLSEVENLLEILLRLVRGERATAFQSSATISGSSLSGPLLTALDQGTAHGPQQTHVSLAVLAMFQMTLEYATKAIGANAKKEVEGRIGEIIRCLPSHLIYKSLDGMFKEWKAEKKGQGR